MSDNEIVPTPELSRPAELSEPDGAPEPEADRPHGQTAGRLMGRVAVVSGGDAGLGQAVALAFAAEGADVAILYLDAHEAAQETMQRIVALGCATMAVTGDIGLSQFCDDAVAEIVKRFGRIDVLVNAAADPQVHADFEQIGDGEIARSFGIHIFGQIYLARAVLPHLRRGAAIVNTSSAAAFAGHPVQITDAASQAAVVGFTRSLALALLPRGIRVNAVAPGPVSPPEAVALSYVFLAGREGSCMNGQILHTDGGAGPGG